MSTHHPPFSKSSALTLLSAALILMACAAPSQPSPAAVTAPQPSTPMLSPPTPQPPPAATPDLSRRPLVWFGPLPQMPTRPGRPFTGSLDFMELFQEDAPWANAARRVGVFKLFGEWVSGDATDAELRQVFADLSRRGIAVDVDEGPLTPTPACGNGVEGFAGTNEGLHIARRVKAAGGAIHLIDMDEPFVDASIYDGPNACHWPAEKIARDVADYIRVMKEEFPAAIIGDSEPLWQGMRVEDLERWLEAYHAATGSYFPFFHLDLDYTRPDWAEAAKKLEAFCRERGIAFGIYYDGNWNDLSDEAWLAQAGERVKTYELGFGGRPDHVIFQSWNDHPDYSLPETQPDTFTNFVDLYFEDRAALGVRTTGPGANLAFGKTARASRSLAGFEPGRAVDGSPETWWGAGAPPPQWIEIDLGAPYAIAAVRLRVSQYPNGATTHRVFGKGPGTGGKYVLLHEFKGTTADLDSLEYTPPSPWEAIQFVRIETASSPSWVAWREVEIIAP